MRKLVKADREMIEEALKAQQVEVAMYQYGFLDGWLSKAGMRRRFEKNVWKNIHGKARQRFQRRFQPQMPKHKPKPKKKK